MAVEHLFIRHGHYDDVTLSERGHQQSQAVAEKLAQRTLSSDLILLSSDAPRALQTAEHIAELLQLPIFPTRRVNIAGNNPEVVADLDDYLQASAAEAGATLEDESQLLVVAHAPLLAAVGGRRTYDTDGIGYCEVLPYQPGSWNPQNFRQSAFDRHFPAG